MRPRRTGAPSLSPEDAANVRQLLGVVFASDFAGDRSKCAEALGISRQALNKLLAGLSGASYETSRKLAAHRGVPVDWVLRGLVTTPTAAQKPARDAPALRRALKRLEGLVGAEVLAAVNASFSDKELSEGEWVKTVVLVDCLRKLVHW